MQISRCLGACPRTGLWVGLFTDNLSDATRRLTHNNRKEDRQTAWNNRGGRYVYIGESGGACRGVQNRRTNSCDECVGVSTDPQRDRRGRRIADDAYFRGASGG